MYVCVCVLVTIIVGRQTHIQQQHMPSICGRLVTHLDPSIDIAIAITFCGFCCCPKRNLIKLEIWMHITKYASKTDPSLTLSLSLSNSHSTTVNHFSGFLCGYPHCPAN